MKPAYARGVKTPFGVSLDIIEELTKKLILVIGAETTKEWRKKNLLPIYKKARRFLESHGKKLIRKYKSAKKGLKMLTEEHNNHKEV